ncbi:hypothetical protein FZC35_00470 [Candidatus Cytomitobacter indipagum]|uniref:Uncharacterized protein n=1 Tax=Candidatus Cytomitobacter indipagum TaxID=2601575 RepID=A0A5C0UDP1_9PROT|nr:hypothetical protein [Candidatus Cytomitobacter indipagum]QEK37861.1 hypothetical protein FZC35_00470 [Candidatus Cytomitobacter indipagum]
MLCALTIMIIGCENKQKRYSLETLGILSSQNMNNNSVVRLDLIQVFEQSLWDTISKMKGKEYFQNRKSLLAHNSQHIKVWSFEPLPQTKLEAFCIANWSPVCYGAIVFMSYESDKKNSFTLSPKVKHLNIKLGPDAIEKASSVGKIKSGLKYRQTYSIGANHEC